MLERVCVHKLYNNKWIKDTGTLCIDPQPFSEGSCRWAYRGKLVCKNEEPMIVVCKFSKLKNTPRALYFQDVEAQECGRKYSNDFNQHSPPLSISFVPAFVLELVERPGRPLCGCERYIEGEFRKYNNNVGAVNNNNNTSLEAETAQAFSHFTYERSNHKLLICDIQGFSGVFTDPQIHLADVHSSPTSNNLGITGIRAFLLRHACNRVCFALNLPRHGKVGRKKRQQQQYNKSFDATVSSSSSSFGNSNNKNISKSPPPPSSFAMENSRKVKATSQHKIKDKENDDIHKEEEDDDDDEEQSSLINESDEHLMESILRDLC